MSIELFPKVKVMDGASREIPSRAAMKTSGAFQTYGMKDPETAYEQSIAQALFPQYSPKTLQFNPPKSYQPVFPIKNDFFLKKMMIQIGVNDEYYQNNLDWGKKFIGINMDMASFIYDVKTNAVAKIYEHKCELRSLKWNPLGDVVAIGNVETTLVFADVSTRGISSVHIRDFTPEGLPSPIFSIDWRDEQEVTFGTQAKITHYDRRTETAMPFSPNANRIVSYSPNADRIISLEWSSNGNYLASGTGDDHVQVFDRRMTKEPIVDYKHLASVKALKWKANSSLLLSGGGIADQTVKLFDVKKAELLFEKHVGSQVSAVEFLDDRVVALGLGLSANKIQLLDCDLSASKFNYIANLPEQGGRVLNLSKDPSSTEFCSAAVIPQRELCIWGQKKPLKNRGQAPVSPLAGPILR